MANPVPAPAFWALVPDWLALYFQRWVPFVACVSIVGVALTSEVAPDLILVSGNYGYIVVYLYAAVLAALALSPDEERLHYVGGVLSVFTVTARLLGFLTIVLEGDGVSDRRYDLIGAVLERVWLLALMFGWHVAMASRIGSEIPAPSLLAAIRRAPAALAGMPRALLRRF